MNIFVLDSDPITAAKMHCDKHCVKMVVELYQQLGSAVRRHGATDSQMPLTSNGKPLKGGYANHPCTRWCGDSRHNFIWAAMHGIALSMEYSYRYDKIHSCHEGLIKLLNMFKLIPYAPLMPFAQAMPDQYKIDNDAVTAYRNLYWFDKRHKFNCVWTRRSKPKWWIDFENKELGNALFTRKLLSE